MLMFDLGLFMLILFVLWLFVVFVLLVYLVWFVLVFFRAVIVFVVSRFLLLLGFDDCVYCVVMSCLLALVGLIVVIGLIVL